MRRSFASRYRLALLEEVTWFDGRIETLAIVISQSDASTSLFNSRNRRLRCPLDFQIDRRSECLGSLKTKAINLCLKGYLVGQMNTKLPPLGFDFDEVGVAELCDVDELRSVEPIKIDETLQFYQRNRSVFASHVDVAVETLLARKHSMPWSEEVTPDPA